MTRSKLKTLGSLRLVLGVVLASSMMLGANCQAPDTQAPDTEEPPGGTTEPPGGTTEPPGGAKIEAEIPRAVHADMQRVINEVYGGGQLIEHSEEKGDVEVVWQLDYELERAHRVKDATKLEDALSHQGYTIDEHTPTESLGIFVHKGSIGDADILVSASEGSKSFGVSIKL